MALKDRVYEAGFNYGETNGAPPLTDAEIQAIGDKHQEPYRSLMIAWYLGLRDGGTARMVYNVEAH